MRLLSVGLSAILLTAFITAQAKAPAPADEQLVYTLFVMRHGIRSPTSDGAQYDRFSVAPWPRWTVPPGYLTPHGYEVIKRLGAYDREELAAQGLFTPASCAEAAQVFVHADSDQRTRETAKALVETMFPGCPVEVSALREGTRDPLFHLPAVGISPEKARAAAAAVLDRIGNDPERPAATYHAQLSELDRLLATCGTTFPPRPRTSIFDVPASVTPGNDDHLATVRGPLSTAGTLTENLLLEYTEGMPAQDVGWGCVDGTKLRKLIELHTASSDLAQRTSAVAVPQASALLRVIDLSIEQAVTGRAVPGAEGKPGDKLLLLVGHDTNLSNIGGALGLHWLLDGRRDDTPPGSALIFEVWKSRALRTYSVRIFFASQTLEQMRNASSLTLRNPPPKVFVPLPACSRSRDGCEVSAFEHALEVASAGADGDILAMRLLWRGSVVKRYYSAFTAAKYTPRHGESRSPRKQTHRKHRRTAGRSTLATDRTDSCIPPSGKIRPPVCLSSVCRGRDAAWKRAPPQRTEDRCSGL